MSDRQGRRQDGQAPRQGSRGGGQRRDSGQGSSQRSPHKRPDPARMAAYELQRRVNDGDAYANLALPEILRDRRVSGRDAAFATELAYGTLRLRARYDAVLSRCLTGRELGGLDAEVLDVMRLGAHQLLGMRVPVHAAVSETVGLARAVVGPGPTGIVNAVLRAVADKPLEEWLEVLAGERSGEEPESTDQQITRLAVTESHPQWIVRALRQGLAAEGFTGEELAVELAAVLAANNAPPRPTLVARPGLVHVEDLAAETAKESGTAPVPGRWSPFALTAGGDPARLASVRSGAAGVQDEGSQVVALALLSAEIEGADARWLDLCAGPGGKAALLGATALQEGASLLANEVAPHRSELVRGALRTVLDQPGEPAVVVRTGDGRELGEEMPGEFDRVLVDAPCTGLGALRRRPEARWRRQPSDLATLGPLQRELLASALEAVRPGGVVAYVTCSPHIAETRLVVEDVLRRRDDVELLDAAAALRDAAVEDPGVVGPYVQLWPHRHGTDAMFLALLRRVEVPRASSTARG